MRADAKRNRDKIVAAAREIFRTNGYDASLDEVAKRAGVGPGTLYRHFPCREDLMNAVMQAWIDNVETAVEKALAQDVPPRELLLSWFTTYIELISRHKGGPAKLTAAMDNPESPIRTKCQVLRSAHQRILDRVGERQALRSDVDALHVARLVGGLATVADQSDLELMSLQPMLAVIVDGMLVEH